MTFSAGGPIKKDRSIDAHQGEYIVNIFWPAKQEKFVTLPDAETMLHGLKKACNNDPYLQEKLFPSILKHEKEEKVPVGVVLIVIEAVDDYEQKVLGHTPGAARSYSCRAVRKLRPKILEALIADAQALSEAQDILNADSTRGATTS